MYYMSKTFRELVLLLYLGNCHYIEKFLLVLNLRVMTIVGIEFWTFRIQLFISMRRDISTKSSEVKGCILFQKCI
jgi:hypothetical protein